jgi:hypothetical protein
MIEDSPSEERMPQNTMNLMASGERFQRFFRDILNLPAKTLACSSWRIQLE